MTTVTRAGPRCARRVAPARHAVAPFRPLVLALLLALAASDCSGSVDTSACQQAGGVCEDLTPGACLGRSAGDSTTYPCDEQQVCCLPSPCVLAGGTCPVTCTTGHLDTSKSCGNGAGQCCMP